MQEIDYFWGFVGGVVAVKYIIDLIEKVSGNGNRHLIRKMSILITKLNTVIILLQQKGGVNG